MVSKVDKRKLPTNTKKKNKKQKKGDNLTADDVTNGVKEVKKNKDMVPKPEKKIEISTGIQNSTNGKEKKKNKKKKNQKTGQSNVVTNTAANVVQDDKSNGSQQQTASEETKHLKKKKNQGLKKKNTLDKKKLKMILQATDSTQDQVKINAASKTSDGAQQASPEEKTNESTDSNILKKSQGVKKKKEKGLKKKKLKKILQTADISPDQVKTTGTAVSGEQVTETLKKTLKASKKGAQIDTRQEFANIAENIGETHLQIPKAEADAKEVQGIATGRLRQDNIREKNPEEEKRTIFIGNLDIKVSRDSRKIKKLFQEFGQIETIRFRNAAVADQKSTKRLTVMKGSFHPSQTTICAYLRFKKEESVEKALAANNRVFMEKHLRVDRALGNSNVDKQCSIFIGNLSFDTQEEELYETFQDCGAIESVRVVRDKAVGAGKGFAYVNFKSKDGVELALQMKDASNRGRQLRISRYMTKDQADKKKKMRDRKMVGNRKKMQLSFMSTSKKGSGAPATTFTGDKFRSKDKTLKKKKVKARWTDEQKKKRAVAKFLAG